jgi:hypothetical protein
MDILFPTNSSGRIHALFSTDGTGGEFEAGANNGIGFVGGSLQGTLTPNVWHRVAIAVDTGGTVSTFIDGAKVGEENTPGGQDGGFAITAGINLFDDANTNSVSGYIASLQFQDQKLPDGLIATLGAPTPGGILTGPPPNPYVVSEAPISDLRFPGRSTVSPLPLIQVVLADGAATVNTSSVQVKLDNTVVSATVGKSGATTTITYQVPSALVAGSLHSVALAYKDSANDSLGVQYQFNVGAFTPLPGSAAGPVGSAATSGFVFRIAQAPPESAGVILPDNYTRAIEQLDGSLLDTNGVPYVNEAIAGPNPDGSYFVDGTVIAFELNANTLNAFPNAPVAQFPGIPGVDAAGEANTDNFADETLAYLALKAGSYTFGVDVGIDRVDSPPGADDGYRLYCGANPRDYFSTLVGEFVRTGDNFNTRQNTNQFTFLAPVDGVYPFRLVHWQNNLGANLAWYSVDAASGDKILINDPADVRSIPAYRVSTLKREPYIGEVSPPPGAAGVAANAPIVVVLGDDDLKVNPSSIQLFLNGAKVTPASVSANAGFTTVLYNPNATRATVTNTVEVVYSDNATPTPNSFTNSWSFTIVVTGGVAAKVTGQWDFQNGDLAATVGKDLQYLDGASGASKANTVFGTTTSLGVPDIGGVPTKIVKRIGTINSAIGYIMDHGIAPNGGGNLVNQYTIIFDIFKKSGTTTLFNCQSTNNTTDGSIFWQNNDIGQGAGGYVDKGTATSGVWHRIALAVDLAATPPVVTKFVDGIKQQDWVQPGLDLPRRSWQHTVLLIADGDGDDMTDTYVSSVQVRDGKLTDAQLVLLGGPSADKIPLEIPNSSVTGQWDFKSGDLSATIGKDLQYLDGTSGASVANTVFGTTTDLGVSDIDGTPTKILKRIGTINSAIGYIMDHGIAPNGGGNLVNQYTIIFDIFKKGGTTTLFNCQSTNNTTDGSIFWQGNDIGQGAGGYVDKGTATSGVWHRIALAADMAATPPVITKFVDGIKQQDWVQPGLDLPRRSWQHTVLLIADGDGDDMTDTYVSSVQVRNGKLSDAQLVALGAPSPTGIPVADPVTSVTGQWDFQSGDLSATVGKDLQYLDGPGGASVANTVFSTTDALGISGIDGTPSKIMERIGTINSAIGYIMDHGIPPNGGGKLVNQYTIIFDIFKKGGTTSLFDCQSTNNTTDGSIFWQGNDIGQGAGGYVDLGTATSGAWHRIALAADMGATPPVITKFVDGIKQQDWVQPGLDLPRRSWQHTVLLFADGDGDDMTDTYVRSVQVSSTKLSDAALVALGGASPNGIPVVVPFATPPPPTTLAFSFSAGSFTVSWPGSVTGLTLQSSPTLANPTWTPVSGVVNNSVTLPIGGGVGALFFRLSQ